MRAFINPISNSLLSPLYFMTNESFFGTEVNSYKEIYDKLLTKYVIKKGQSQMPFFLSFMPSEALDKAKKVGDEMAKRGCVNLFLLPRVKEIKILRTCFKYGECEEDARHRYVVFMDNKKSYYDGLLKDLVKDLNLF